ncbi:MAG: outer membrane protein assembly factor BamB family protein [Acidimicrobiales bacterium]
MRLRVIAAMVGLAVAMAACSSTPGGHGPAGTSSKTPSSAAVGSPFGPTTTYAETAKLRPGPNLAPGSDPGALPGDVLIADRDNNRLVVVDPSGDVVWQFPRPGDLAPGQSFVVPDDAFFTPNGRDIIATEEGDFAITEISVARHAIVWRYGHPGVPGSAPDYLDNPDDAMMLPNGDVVSADIKNCRLLVLDPPSLTPLEVIGETTNACYHEPPLRWGSPNGAFPMANGDWIVTEINGDWIDELSLHSGQVHFSAHPPGVAYPSDTNEVSPGVYLTADYSTPGQVEEFTASGRLLWRYQPTGAAALNSPSLALPLPNGDVILNDDLNHRVIVVDPRTGQVVWQYGHTALPGSAPGYLDNPDGIDLVPPYSLAVSHAATEGLP